MTEQPPAWPEQPASSAGLFAGAARDYARYRLPYPLALIDDLRSAADLTRNAYVLDLGCGTGEVALALAPYVAEVWAIDQEPEMIAVGQEKAQRMNAANVRWFVGQAEEVAVPSSKFQLITFGNAFHRMDRRLVAAHAKLWLASNGCLAVLGGSNAWDGGEEWQRAVAETIRRHRGKDGASGAAVPSARHEDVLRLSGFEVDEREYELPFTWTLDHILGWVRSTGFASPKVLRNGRQALEADLRQALLAFDSGEYHATVAFFLMLARVAVQA